MLLVKMSRHYVYEISSTTYFQRHFVQWHFVNITFCPQYFVCDILSGHPCRYTAAVQPASQNGYVESQYRKFKQWSLVRIVSVWLVCGQSGRDGLPVVGFIASRSDGWFVCLYRLFGRIYGRWLACRLICLLSSLSVGWAIRPTGYVQLITVWPANHPSIWSLNNRPETVLFSELASDQYLNFRNRRFDVSSFLFGWLAAVGLPDPCLQVAGQVWSVFHLASQWGIPSLLDPLSSDRSGNAQKRVCNWLRHAMYVNFSMLRIQLSVIPIPLYL